MPTPDVTVVYTNRPNVTVECPLADCTTRIPRDQTAWRAHFENDHGVSSSSWTTVAVVSGGSAGLIDDESGQRRYDYGHVCYGCGSTFATAAELTAHMTDDHSAS